MLECQKLSAAPPRLVFHAWKISPQVEKHASCPGQVCENIVIPNTRLRDDAEEMFEFNWLEYVRQDTEGSDADTRRRAACELVRALTDKFPAEVRVV